VKWPRWPAGWSVVAQSVELPRRAVRTVDFAGEEVVLFRGDDGVARAVDAFCPHMGAHLGSGEVRGDALRCGLHHRLVDGAGRCSGGGRGRGYVAAERFGLVFVTREGFSEPLPDVVEREGFTFTTSAPVRVKVPWVNFVLNGFDLPHLEAVHHRRLLSPAKVVREGHCMRLDYETCVTGRGPSDLAMRALSGNHVRARMSCFGTVGVVEADLGWTRSVLICGVTPRTETQTDAAWPTGESTAWLSFGVPRGAFAGRVRAALTKWLYLAFLSRDFVVLERQRLSMEGVDDASTRAVAEFLSQRDDWRAR
jgi:nitrite reductase/ring-hydroxylating ferredoxin subunit